MKLNKTKFGGTIANLVRIAETDYIKSNSNTNVGILLTDAEVINSITYYLLL